MPWDFDGDGLPISVQLVGRPYDEATLLSLSAQIEAADRGPTGDRRCHTQASASAASLAPGRMT